MSGFRCTSCPAGRNRFTNERAAVRHVLINAGHSIIRSFR